MRPAAGDAACRLLRAQDVSKKSDAVERILDRLHQTAEAHGRVTVGHMVEALGDRGWGPFLFVPALLEISPIGGIPGVPTLLALIIAIFAAQIAWGRDHMWLPELLRRRSVSGEKMRAAVDKMRPAGRFLDRWFHGRFPSLTSDKATRIAAVVVILLCLTVPPLELLPFASTGPMVAIAAFGLALTMRDGLLMALGFVLSALAVGLGVFLGGK